MQQIYETIYILQPELTEEEVDANVGLFEGILKDHEADHHKTEKWGKKRLAYRVKNHWEGFYVLMEYETVATTVDELERRLRIHDNVLKWMSVRKDPRAAIEEERRAARLAKAQAQRGEGAPPTGDSPPPPKAASEKPAEADKPAEPPVAATPTEAAPEAEASAPAATPVEPTEQAETAGTPEESKS